jgi:hypothetical protein
LPSDVIGVEGISMTPAGNLWTLIATRAYPGEALIRWMQYDRARGSLDRHATYIVAACIAGAASQAEQQNRQDDDQRPDTQLAGPRDAAGRQARGATRRYVRGTERAWHGLAADDPQPHRHRPVRAPNSTASAVRQDPVRSRPWRGCAGGEHEDGPGRRMGPSETAASMRIRGALDLGSSSSRSGWGSRSGPAYTLGGTGARRCHKRTNRSW